MPAWEETLTALVRARGAALVGYAYLLCGDRAEAEDLVQDALVKTFVRGRDHGTPDSAEAYVRRAVLTTFIDGHRRRRRWGAVRHLLGPDAAAGQETAVTDRLDLLAALGTLSPRQRSCIVLRYYEDLTIAQVADALSLSPGTVKRHLFDAVRRLEEQVGPVVEALPGGGPGTEELDVTITQKGHLS